ncbi:hypothetical protein AAHA92_33199 [Salvia divinorum]|uniref:Uncharacterized protein n=1 Tax=Salvia divinorum TaxID=28513 RepID=A0ABD1FN71_SALDI
MPGKENISQITLRSGKAYEGPIMRAGNRESSMDEGGNDRLIKENGRAVQKDGHQLGDLVRPLPQMTNPFFLDPETEVANEGKEKEREKEEALPESSSSGVPQAKPYP